MASPLPAFELHRFEAPAVGSRVVVRPRLKEVLSRVFDVGIALVSAGAGYGKTVMVSAWASQIEDTTLAWLTCREEHNDIRRLTDELLMVLDGIAVPAGAQFGDVADALRDAGEPVVIVFDDVHRLTSPIVLRALTRFLEHRPDNVVVVASGRDDSLLPWHRFSARAEVVEVRSSDLAFTPEEARELLTATFGIDISDDAAERLCAATEGWAAGLCLAGHALRDTPKRRLIDVEQLGHHRYVRGFIDSEILDDLPADRIRFLEDTSLLQRLDPKLCDLITGRSDSHEVLKGFVERNLFTEESATSPPVYRYHALFADWLRTRVARRGSEHVAALLGIASQWYQQRGEMNLAIDAALRAGDTERVERLIQAAAGPAMRAGFAATVVRWVSALPAESLDRRPELALLLARAAGGSGDLVLARAGIASVERLLKGPTKGALTPSMRLAYHELVFLLRLWTGDFTQAQEEIERAVAFIARHPDDPGYELYSLDELHLELLAAVTHMVLGDLDEATSRVDATLQPSLLVDPNRDAALALGIRSLSMAWRGDDDTAAQRHLEACRSRVRSYRGTTGGPFLFGLAGAWCADLDRAGTDLAAARSITLQLELPIYVAIYQLAEAKYSLRMGWWDRAETALTKADELLSAMPAVDYLTSLASGLRGELDEQSSTALSLSERELAILRELAGGASRREAAKKTYLSINTVKTHLRAAYQKLGVATRDEAVERARALGLLEAPSNGHDRSAGTSDSP